MNYTTIIEELGKASLFDLYRLSSAIHNQLEDPARIAAVKRNLRVGQNLRWFDSSENRLHEAKLLRLNRTRAEVQNLADGKYWNVLYATIDLVGVSPCSGCETGLPSPPFALRSATTIVPRFAPLRATATSRRAPKGAVGLRHGPTSNGLTAYRMRLHLASAAAGLRPSATPARRPRLRLPGTTGLRFALHGRQRGSGCGHRPAPAAEDGPQQRQGRR